MDSVNKAFEDLLVLNLCLKRIHWFSPGVSGKEMRSDGDRCTSCGHWSLITSGVVEKSTVSLKTLIQACRVSRVDAVRSIVSDYEVDVDSTDPYGWTALHFAVLHNQKEVVNCLQTLGARELSTNEGILPSDMRPELLGKEPDSWVPDTLEETKRELMPYTQLIQTSERRMIGRMLRIIDEFGKEIFQFEFVDEEKDIENKCAFIFTGAGFGWVWFCRVYLELGGNVNAMDDDNWTPLLWACHSEKVDCVRLLFDSGADPNSPDVHNWTALHEACCVGNTECVELLLDAGAAVDAFEDFGRTALFTACMKGHIDCAELLVEAGAGLNGPFEDEQTPLHAACDQRHIDCIQLLVKAGADVNVTSVYRQTPLHLVCERKWDVEIVRLLLQAGADVNAVNNQAQTALDVACSRGNEEIVRLLEAHKESEDDEAPSAKRQRCD